MRHMKVLVACSLAVVAVAGCGGKSAFDKAGDEVEISSSQLAISDSVMNGTDPDSGGGDPLAATNELLDALHNAGVSDARERKEIDEALTTFSFDPGYCDACVTALEEARP